MSEDILVATNLTKSFRRAGNRVVALNGVSLTLKRGETIGLVGPSGSGKSTLARILVRLIEPESGALAFDGVDLLAQRGAGLRRLRRRFQMVFQDPLAAFNPRATVAGALADPLRVQKIVSESERPSEIVRLLNRVGLSSSLADRGIGEISGGQRQRVAIARALASRPDLIVLDEAVSALDVSIRGKILDLLVDLQRQDGIAYVFVSHDIAVVRAVAHRIAIMDAGSIVETGPTPSVVAAPRSAIGQSLVAAVPRLLTEQDLLPYE